VVIDPDVVLQLLPLTHLFTDFIVIRALSQARKDLFPCHSFLDPVTGETVVAESFALINLEINAVISTSSQPKEWQFVSTRRKKVGAIGIIAVMDIVNDDQVFYSQPLEFTPCKKVNGCPSSTI
jgi:hypothetical protein